MSSGHPYVPVLPTQGCGNKNPEVRCRQPSCDDCARLDAVKIEPKENMHRVKNGEGYQLMNRYVDGSIGCGNTNQELRCESKNCIDCRKLNNLENAFGVTLTPPTQGCGNKNPEVRCRQPFCEDCYKLNIMVTNGEGYQPINKLDTSKPQGGSGITGPIKLEIKLDEGSQKIVDFMAWFTNFYSSVNERPTVEEWAMVKEKLGELCK